MRSNQNDTQFWNKIVKEIVWFYRRREIKLYVLLKNNKVTDAEIARHLGVSREAISINYGKRARKDTV